MKERISKLDGFAERLEGWFLAGKTLKEAQEELALDGCQVSLGRLSEWWQERQRQRQEEQLLRQIATGAAQVRQVESEFAEHPAPGLETLMGLHRVLVLKLSTEGNANPETLELVTGMMRHVMDYEKVQLKRREMELTERSRDRDAGLKRLEYELAERKFQRESCELFIKWAEDKRAKEVATSGASNSEKIELLGQMMFGADWAPGGAATAPGGAGDTKPES